MKRVIFFCRTRHTFDDRERSSYGGTGRQNDQTTNDFGERSTRIERDNRREGEDAVRSRDGDDKREKRNRDEEWNKRRRNEDRNKRKDEQANYNKDRRGRLGHGGNGRETEANDKLGDVRILYKGSRGAPFRGQNSFGSRSSQRDTSLPEGEQNRPELRRSSGTNKLGDDGIETERHYRHGIQILYFTLLFI